MKKLTAIALAGVALVVGVASGAAAASTPVVQAPHECGVAFHLADRIYVAQDNVSVALHLRATRGRSEFAKHDAEVSRLWGEIDRLKPEYDAARSVCVGAS